MKEFDKKRLQKLQRHEEYESLLLFLAEFIDKLRDENVIGSTEFETLRLLFIRDGKVQGLKQFFDNLDQQLFD